MAGLIIGYVPTDWRWFVGTILLLTKWPTTVLVSMLVIKRLMAMQEREADARSRTMLGQWSAVGAATTLLFVWRWQTKVGAALRWT